MLRRSLSGEDTIKTNELSSFRNYNRHNLSQASNHHQHSQNLPRGQEGDKSFNVTPIPIDFQDHRPSRQGKTLQNDIKDLCVQIYYNSNLIRRDICRSDDYELMNLNNHILKLNEEPGTDLNSVLSLLSAQILQ